VGVDTVATIGGVFEQCTDDIRPGHLLLGILDEDTSTGSRTPAARDVDIAGLRSALGSQVPVESVPPGWWPSAWRRAVR
jgi:hypothetical protein